jgi:predicted Abi (CAAX) family protease
MILDNAFASANFLAMFQAASMAIALYSVRLIFLRKQWLEGLGLLLLITWLAWSSLTTYQNQKPPFYLKDMLLLTGIIFVSSGAAITSKGKLPSNS